MLSGVDRTHVHALLNAGADFELRDPLLHQREELVAGVADRYDERLGHTALARRAVARGDRGVGGEIHVSVGEYDHGVLRAHVAADAFTCFGAPLVDHLTYGCRADELHRLYPGAVEYRVDRISAAVDYVEDAVG